MDGERMTENKRFTINDCRVLSDEQVLKIVNQLTEENEQLKMKNDNLIKISAMTQVRNDKLLNENKELKIKNDLLSDELEQAKAVINKKWDEYLKKKELSE